jgi:hypothetical protein
MKHLWDAQFGDVWSLHLQIEELNKNCADGFVLLFLPGPRLCVCVAVTKMDTEHEKPNSSELQQSIYISRSNGFQRWARSTFFLVHNLNSATVYLQFYKETLLRNFIPKWNFSAFCNIAFFECDVGCLRQWVFVILRELVFTFAEFRSILWKG